MKSKFQSFIYSVRSRIVSYGYRADMISMADATSKLIRKNDIFPLADVHSKKSVAMYLLWKKSEENFL